MPPILLRITFGLLSLGSIATHANPPAVTVSVTDLGTLGGSASSGFGVNNKGQVAGTSRMAGDKNIHGFFYADGKMTDLGTLGGSQSEACALNDAGQVTGNADLRAKDRHHAFLWQQGKMSELGTSRADDSAGLAINSAGLVAGRVIRGTTDRSRACQWSAGKVDTLDISGAYSEVYGSEADAINSNGQVAGMLRKPGRHFTNPFMITYFIDHAALWQGHKVSELSAPGTEIGLVSAINDSGQIVGAASFGPEMTLHACSWRGGKMTDLGTLVGQNTVVYAINRAGLMVGGTNPSDLNENSKKFGDADQPQHAVCFTGGEVIDLNYLIGAASGWVLADARSISDTGYVTGTGIHNGQVHAYLIKLPSTF